jgi:hypothetical protein
VCISAYEALSNEVSFRTRAESYLADAQDIVIIGLFLESAKSKEPEKTATGIELGTP